MCKSTLETSGEDAFETSVFLAKKLRDSRMAMGALELSSAEVKFEMERETMDPIEMKEYVLRL
jgi:hypothetical protein